MIARSGFPISQRDTFLIASGTHRSPDLMHLFIVVSDPAKNSSILVINASTLHPGIVHDPACYLNPDEHPFIRVQSYMVYAKARIMTVQKLQTGVAAGLIIMKGFLAQPIFDRVIAGIDISQVIDPVHQEFYRNFG